MYTYDISKNGHLCLIEFDKKATCFCYIFKVLIKGSFSTVSSLFLIKARIKCSAKLELGQIALVL